MGLAMQAPEEEGEDEDDEEGDGLLRSGRSSRERLPTVPNRQISPLDVRFSQMRARHEFRDGRLLEEAIQLIRLVRWERPVEPGPADGEGAREPAAWRLEAPFPPIEILQWRCKLRDEHTGRPRLDPKTGGELYDQEDRWFTLDNRRLYCLQKVAVSAWPERVVVDVVELPPGPLTRARQLKKFRTLDRGRSVLIGGRGEGETLVRWSWREAAGLEVEGSEPEAENCHVQMRRRPRGRTGGQQQHYAGAARDSGTDESEGTACSRFHPTSVTGMLLFAAIYLALRIIVKVLSTAYAGWS